MGDKAEEARKAFEASVPMNRYATAEEIADLMSSYHLKRHPLLVAPITE